MMSYSKRDLAAQKRIIEMYILAQKTEEINDELIPFFLKIKKKRTKRFIFDPQISRQNDFKNSIELLNRHFDDVFIDQVFAPYFLKRFDLTKVQRRMLY
jgi:hypothetical protein